MAVRELVKSIRRLSPVTSRLINGNLSAIESKPYLQQLSRTVVTSTSSWTLPDGTVQEVPKQGWGQTRIHQLLQSKKDAGSWLWCSMHDKVIDAVRKMTRGNVGSLLVFDPEKLKPTDHPIKEAEGDAVMGIVTERDYLTKVVVMGKSSAELPVSEIMTPQSKLMTVSPSQSVVEVMELMIDNNFRHVPVVYNGTYLGMVSIRDVVSVIVGEHREEVRGLKEYIQGSY